MFRSTTAEAPVEQAVPFRIPSEGAEPRAPHAALPVGSPAGGVGLVGVPPPPPQATARAKRRQTIVDFMCADRVTVL